MGPVSSPWFLVSETPHILNQQVFSMAKYMFPPQPLPKHRNTSSYYFFQQDGYPSPIFSLCFTMIKVYIKAEPI